MKGTSKVIMGATLVMVLSLAIVLGLVLVLLAELYCSLLLRRRQIKNAKNQATATATTPPTAATADQYPSPLSSFYAQGVLHAPRSFLFPMLATTTTREEEAAAGIADDVERQHGKLHQFLSLQAALDNSPPTVHISVDKAAETVIRGGREQLVYISNPMYDNNNNNDGDNDVHSRGRGRGGGGDHTPFETPDSSPSRLERGRGSSEGDDEDGADNKEAMSTTTTPPLTPMKELPAKASSVALRDARSLGGTSGSESTSQNAAFSSTSYSGSPSTSSWCS